MNRHYTSIHAYICVGVGVIENQYVSKKNWETMVDFSYLFEGGCA